MNISAEIQTLFNAIAAGDIDQVESLMKLGISAQSRNIQDLSAIDLACLIGNVCIMEILSGVNL
jgi:Ankyrin repeats (many copies)